MTPQITVSSSSAGAPLGLHPASGHDCPPGRLAVVLLIKWRWAEAWLQMPSEDELKDTQRIIGLQSDVITSVPLLSPLQIFLCIHRKSEGGHPREPRWAGSKRTYRRNQGVKISAYLCLHKSPKTAYSCKASWGGFSWICFKEPQWRKFGYVWYLNILAQPLMH